MERLTYTVNEVAELLGLSRSKTYELVAGGAIPVLAIPGRRKLVARATLQQLVEPSLTASGAAPTTHHDPNHQDPSSIHDRTSSPRPPLPAIPSQPRHSPHTVAPGVPGRSRGARFTVFGSDVATGQERERKTVNISARNRDVDREVAPSSSSPRDTCFGPARRAVEEVWLSWIGSPTAPRDRPSMRVPGG